MELCWQWVEHCRQLYEQCRDVKQSMINEDNQMKTLSGFIQQNSSNSNDVRLHPRVKEAKRLLAERQQIINNMRAIYAEKRNAFIDAIKSGREQLCGLQRELIEVQLEAYKNNQKTAQIGAPFNDKDTQLQNLEQTFVTIASLSYDLRKHTAWMIQLLQDRPEIDNSDQCVVELCLILTDFEQLFHELVFKSFIVTEQPAVVLKKGHKLLTQVRLLVGGELGIRPQLDHARFTVKIVSEETARQLMANVVAINKVVEVGTISIPEEKMDENKPTVTFKHSMLTNIESRKQAKGSPVAAETSDEKSAAATKYFLLFQISPLNIGTRNGVIDIWTLSNPLMVTVHTSQVCLAHAAISWQLAFSPLNWTAVNVESITVNYGQMARMLQFKFSQFTGTRRGLNEDDLAYLIEKLVGPGWRETARPITYHQFAKQTVADGSFSFWTWFYATMELIKNKLIDFWEEGYLIGFISKFDASNKLASCTAGGIILRFSDSMLGAVSIGFCSKNSDDLNNAEPLHLQPFTSKDLEDFTLANRIASCPQLKEIQCVCPNKSKDHMLKRLEKLEQEREQLKNKSVKLCQGNSATKRCYIPSKLVMFIETSSPTTPAATPSPINLREFYAETEASIDWVSLVGSDLEPDSPNSDSPMDQQTTNAALAQKIQLSLDDVFEVLADVEKKAH